MTTRHFLRDDDLTPAEQAEVIRRSIAGKKDRFGDRCLDGPKSVAIIFDKPTLRTQVSFMAGIAELGGYPMMIDGKLAQIGERESISDVGKVLGRQVSAIVWRTYAQSRLEEMASVVDVPVINALTDDFHPCQILADLVTMTEYKGDLKGATMAYLGDGANNMANSYAIGCVMAGMHVRIAAQGGHQPKPEIVARAQELAAQTGGSLTITGDAREAATGADVIVTDTWVSMGMEAEKAERRGEGNPFAAFQVTDEIMALAAPDAIFLHCLPAYRGFEVAASVIDGPASVVFQEAENRLHAQKGLISFLVEHSD